MQGRIDIVTLLLDCGANIEAADKVSLSPKDRNDTLKIYELILEWKHAVDLCCLVKPVADCEAASSEGCECQLYWTGKHKIQTAK